jgi:hypothetical protein
MSSAQLGVGVDPAPHALHAAPPPAALKPVKVRIHPSSASVSIDVAAEQPPRPKVAVSGEAAQDEPRLVSTALSGDAPRYGPSSSADDPTKPLLALSRSPPTAGTAHPPGDGSSAGSEVTRPRSGSLNPASVEYGAGAFKPARVSGGASTGRRGSADSAPR